MTRFDAADPAERRALVAEAVLAHRERASEVAVFEAAATDDGESTRITYADRVLTLECTDEARGRLDDLLGEYPVFKIKQPDTRKAPEGTVHLSALADPKHVADFVDDAFPAVYDLPGDYRLWVVRV